MILYSKNPLPIQMRNVMLLDDDSTGGVVYVSKATYDQATILWSRFEGNALTLLNILKVDTNKMKSLPGRFEAVQSICGNAPKPLDILGPFVELFMENKNLDWENATMVDYYGWLHQVSQMIDFNAITLVPKEIAAKAEIPSTILKSYEESWRDLTDSLMDRTVMSYSQPVQQVVTQSVQTTVVPTAPAVTPTLPKEEKPSSAAVSQSTETNNDEEDYGDIWGSSTFDFAAHIDPDFEMPGSSNNSSTSTTSTTNTPTESGSNYAEKASSLLSEFDELD